MENMYIIYVLLGYYLGSVLVRLGLEPYQAFICGAVIVYVVGYIISSDND